MKLLTNTLFPMAFFAIMHAATAAKFVTAPGAGEVTFLAIGKPTFLNIEGKGSVVEGNLEVSNAKTLGNFKFNLAQLDTGMELRNEHMKDKYLEVSKFPESTLTITNLKAAKSLDSFGQGIGEGTFEGTLQIKGKTKDIKGKFKGSADAGKEKIDAQFEILLTDFGIEIPSFAGVTVADKVDVKVATLLEPEKK